MHELSKITQHEQASLVMFDYLIESNKLRGEFKKVWEKFPESKKEDDQSKNVSEDLEFIKQLIDRKPDEDPKHRPKKKFLYEVYGYERM